MKDLVVYKAGSSTILARLRVDSLSADGAQGNLTIMETYGLDQREPNMPLDDADLQLKVGLANFGIGKTDFGTFKAFIDENDATVIMKDVAGKVADVTFAGTITITESATLTAGTVSVAYNNTVSVTGGSGSYTFAVTSGALPTGLTLHPTTGVISGTPTTGQTTTPMITVTDAVFASLSAVKAFSITINP